MVTSGEKKSRSGKMQRGLSDISYYAQNKYTIRIYHIIGNITTVNRV